jgi:anti-sigma factor RsiW
MDHELFISQYADGTIEDRERAALEGILAESELARETLADERRLTQLLRETSAPLPAIDWESLGSRISSAVAEAQEPASSYRLMPRWVNIPMALAASLLLASAIGFTIYLSGGHATAPTGAVATANKGVLIVTGPLAEAAPDNVVSEITIGPPANSADKFSLAQYSHDVVTRPARVVIASGINPPSDLSSLPY